MRAPLQLAVLLLALAAPAPAPALAAERPGPPPCERYGRLVKAFLFQDFKLIDGARYTAPRIAHRQRNALAALGLQGDPEAERVRAAVAADFGAHRLRYVARSRIAQAEASRAARDDERHYQETLWRTFMDDSRYTSRIYSALGQAACGGEPPPRTARRAEVARIHEALRVALERRGRRPGCNANPITAFAELSDVDPLLAADIFEIVTASTSESQPLEEVAAELHRRDWRIEG